MILMPDTKVNIAIHCIFKMEMFHGQNTQQPKILIKGCMLWLNSECLTSMDIMYLNAWFRTMAIKATYNRQWQASNVKLKFILSEFNNRNLFILDSESTIHVFNNPNLLNHDSQNLMVYSNKRSQNTHQVVWFWDVNFTKKLVIGRGCIGNILCKRQLAYFACVLLKWQ